MANYNTNLDDWGATGKKPPSGYAYEENVPPVDLYDNYLMNNVINDIQHLTSLTNDRLESEAGTSQPSSPEDGHLFADSDDGKLEWYNPSSGAWSRALDATGDKLDGVIDMGGYQIEDSTGSLTLDGDVNVSNGQISEKSNRVATRTWATGSNISHSDLADSPSSAHHTRYSGSEARSAVEGANFDRLGFNNTEFSDSPGEAVLGFDNSEGLKLYENGAWHQIFTESHPISHNTLDISSNDHHSRYSDNEARSAVEAGNVSQIEGINGHRISFSSNGSYVELVDHSGNRNKIVTADTYVNNANDSNNESWLSDHLPASDAHHSRYSDSESREAIEGTTMRLSSSDSKVNLPSDNNSNRPNERRGIEFTVSKDRIRKIRFKLYSNCDTLDNIQLWDWDSGSKITNIPGSFSAGDVGTFKLDNGTFSKNTNYAILANPDQFDYIGKHIYANPPISGNNLKIKGGAYGDLGKTDNDVYYTFTMLELLEEKNYEVKSIN